MAVGADCVDRTQTTFRTGRNGRVDEGNLDSTLRTQPIGRYSTGEDRVRTVCNLRDNNVVSRRLCWGDTELIRVSR